MTDLQGSGVEGELRELLSELPDELAGPALTHSSWTSRRSDSYERLAFLGDSVLGLAITADLYPRLEAERYGAGRLTKIRAQAVSGRACRDVAERLGLPDRLREAAPASAEATIEGLLATERVLASVIEAVIGACYLAFGYERTAQAVVSAFAPEVADALEHPVDFKSALQERLARQGALVVYEVVERAGTAPRADVRGQRTDRGQRARPGLGPVEEGRRAGGRAGGAGRAGLTDRAVTDNPRRSTDPRPLACI